MGRKKVHAGKPGSAASESGSGGENISQYWKQFFSKHPKMLKVRSNEAALTQWKADHPGTPEVPPSVVNGLTNVKSQLRHKRKGKRGRPPMGSQPTSNGVPVARSAKLPAKLLEALEDQIDQCLGLIGGHEGSREIVQTLKHARRLTILQMSQ
jgi:hypothetical protein